MDLTSSAGVVLTLGCVYWLYKRRTLSTPTPMPPGPRGPSVILSFIKAVKTFSLHLYANRWYHKYGDIVGVSLFNQNFVFLNSSSLVKKCFSDDTFNGRTVSFASTFIFKNENIGFSPLGRHHSRLRKLFHGSLKLYGNGVKVFEETIMEELKHVVVKIQSRPEVMLDDIISKSLLSVLHILLTDERADHDSPTIKEMEEYNSVINSLFGPDFDQPLTVLPFLRHVPGPFKTICDKAESKMESLSRLLLEPVKARYTRGEPRGLIQAAMEARNDLNDDSKMSEEHIRLLMLEIISAGYLTTKGILLGILLVLIELPDTQEKVYELIRKRIGNRPVTVADRPALPYVDAMIIEASRYLAHGPLGLPHKTVRDLEVDGYRIAKDSIIFANLWTLGHSETVWDSPWTFRPERFLDDQGELLPVDHPIRQRFLPFGVGKRQCPGEVFAKTRLFLFITTLVQHFKLLPPDGGMTSSSDPRTWTPGIMMQPENILCRVELRDTRPLLE